MLLQTQDELRFFFEIGGLPGDDNLTEVKLTGSGASCTFAESTVERGVS